jgi:hypothetical protein
VFVVCGLIACHWCSLTHVCGHRSSRLRARNGTASQMLDGASHQRSSLCCIATVKGFSSHTHLLRMVSCFWPF